MSGLLIVGLPALIQGAFSWGLAESLPESRLLVVFVLILPIFTYFFLAGAWFMRTLLKFATGVR